MSTAAEHSYTQLKNKKKKWTLILPYSSHTHARESKVDSIGVAHLSGS